MKHTLLIAAITVLVGGVAYADHGHGGHGPVIRGGGGGGGGPVIRDHRAGNPVAVREHERGGGPVIRDHRGGPTHVRMSGGRYVFPGGVVRVYHRPVIREHYYNVHVRPAIIAEEYDPVPGYVWVRGGWTWGGGEWVWTPGYWAADAAPVVVQGPVVSGGVSVSAGVSF